MTISRRGFFGVMGIGSLIPVNSVAEIKDEIRIIRIRWRKPRNDYTLIINGQLIDTKECHYEFKAKWRLQYKRAIDEAGKVDGIVRIR